VIGSITARGKWSGALRLLRAPWRATRPTARSDRRDGWPQRFKALAAMSAPHDSELLRLVSRAVLAYFGFAATVSTRSA